MISLEKTELSKLVAKIDELLPRGRLIMSIDGGSASGKTTLSALLAKKYDATVFHMDDFFLTPEMRTAKRLSEAGGNVDRERFEKEVLVPLSKGEDINYRPYDCKSGAFKESKLLSPKSFVIIEGAYSMHPELMKYYGFSVFLNIDKKEQRTRILKRNGDSFAQRFFDEWIPLENMYFEKTDIKNRCDLIIDI